MASEAEPAKLLLPYLQRADELQKHEPLVAYYCRLYAMEKGLKIPQKERTKTTNSLLISLMNQLEKDKKSLTLGPDDSLHVEGFALNVFGKADKQDRAGRADLNTAKTFYAASLFFEILNQFGLPQPDLEQKQKYAVWKAADIRKALKEGRIPTPGPPSGEDDLSLPSSGSYDIGPSDSTPINPRNEPDQAMFHESINNDRQHSPNLPPPSKYHDDSNDQNHNFQYCDNKPNDHHFHDDNINSNINNQNSINLPSVPRTYPTSGYAPHDFDRPETSSEYPQPYQNQSLYGQEPHQNLPPQNYPPENPFYSNPHFQSYPSFSESSLPAVPPHYPSYYQGSGDTANYAPATPPPPPPPAPVSHNPAAQYQPGLGRTGPGSESGHAPVSAPAKSYEFDGSYQAPPEKLAEAQKAARLAVGALAFDDVSVAVDYLRRSLELLTNPSAKTGH